MKKVLFALASVAFLALGMTACQKDETVIKFKATIERGNSKTSLNAVNGDNEHPITWEPYDEIKVWGGNSMVGYHCITQSTGPTAEFVVADHNSSLGTYRSFAAGYPAEYWTTGAGSHLVTLPVQRVYREEDMYKFPMYAESSNTELCFKNVCGVLKIVLPSFANTSLIGIDVYANSAIAGNFIVTMRDGIPHVANGSESEIEMQFDEPISLDGGKSFYIYLPPSDDLTTTGGFNDFEMVFYTSDGHYGVAKANGPIRIERSKITTVTLNGISFNEVVETSANYFSVSPSLKVDISTGNLQYTTTGWRFAPHQYDFIGTKTGEVVDMFARSSSGNHFGLSSYQGTSISTIEGDFVDWGTCGVPADRTPWRTLSHSEWNYLLHYRDNAEQLFHIVMISDLTNSGIGVASYEYEWFSWDDYYQDQNIFGMLIFPDESDVDISNHSIDDDWEVISITSSELSNYIQAKGAVFLPMVFAYQMGLMVNPAPHGLYWNSDMQYCPEHRVEGDGINGDPIEPAYWGQSVSGFAIADNPVWFGQEHVTEQDPTHFSYYSVRLVHDAMYKNAANEWDYYDGFDPTQNTGSAKGKRRK